MILGNITFNYNYVCVGHLAVATITFFDNDIFVFFLIFFPVEATD